MMFKTIDGELKVFNNNLTKSTGLQNAYIKSVGNQNQALGNYLAGLKGAPATFSGYIASLTKAKLATIGLQAASIALNMALTMGISFAIQWVITLFDYLIHRTEKMQEALQNSVDEFNTTTDELKSLEEELKTTTERLEELQKLADNGTISIAEEAELKTLKETNKELARKVALKQQEQAQEARDVLKDSKKNANSTVTSKYEEKTTASGNYTYGASITPDKELELAIKARETYSKAAEKNKGTNLEGWYEDQTEIAENRIEEMYALISPTIEAYESLINAGIELEGEDKARYEQLKKTQDAYLEYVYILNGTREAFEGLNAEQQRNVLLNRLIKQGLSEDVAKAIVGSISEEDLSKYWDKNFSFVPPEMKDGETAEEYGKRYAEAWAKGLQEGVKNVDKMTVSLSEMKNASESISALSSAFKEISDDGYITTETLEKIKTATGLADDEWEDYENKLLNAKKGSSEFNQVLSDLTYTILENKFGTLDLADATDDEVSAIESKIAATLRENGVVNANAVAHKYVEAARADAKIAAYAAGDATYEEAKSFIEESLSAEQAEKALVQLEIVKRMVNSTQIDTSQDIDEIIALANAAGASTQFLQDLARAKAELSEGFVGPVSPTTQSMVDGGYTPTFDMLDSDDFDPKYTNKSSGKSTKDVAKEHAKKQEEYAEKIIDIQENLADARADYAEKVADITEDLAEKEQQFAEDMAEAWKEEHLEQLKDSLEERKDIINRYKEDIDISDFGLDLIGEDDFTNRSNLLTNKLDQLTTYGMAMRQEFERVASIIPQTGEEAQELANRLTELGDDMRDNVSTIRETKVAIMRLRVDTFASMADTHMSELERELDNIGRRIEILTSDDKDEYKYTNKVLSMSSLLPTYSDFSKQRKEKERQDKELIQLEQTTQNTINGIVTRALEMQSRENAAAREKERQNLIRDMEKAREDAAKKLAEAQKDLENSIKEAGEKLQDATEDYKEFLEDNKIATDSTLAYVEQAIADADLVFPKPDTSQFQAAVDDIIAQIGVVKTELSGLEGATGTNGNHPPAGSTSWFNTGADGHAGINDGKGGVWHNSNGVLKYSQLSNMKNYMGWGWSGGIPMDAATAKKIVEIAQNPSKYNIPIEPKYCQRFVSYVYGVATGKSRYNFTANNAKEAADAWIIGHAKGTPFHPGGLAMVGDENWLKGWNKPAPELAIYPDGTSEVLGEDGVEIRDLPRGTRVVPAKQTKEILGGIPNYASGTASYEDLFSAEYLLNSLRTARDNAMSGAQAELSRSQLNGYPFNETEYFENLNWQFKFGDKDIFISGYRSLEHIISLLENLQGINKTELKSFQDIQNLVSHLSSETPYMNMIAKKEGFEQSGEFAFIDDSAIEDYLWREYFTNSAQYGDFEALKNIDGYFTGNLTTTDKEIIDYYKSLAQQGVEKQRAVEEAKKEYITLYNEALLDPNKTVDDILFDMLNPNTPLGAAYKKYIDNSADRDASYNIIEEQWANKEWIIGQAIQEANNASNLDVSNRQPLVLGGGKMTDEYRDYTNTLADNNLFQNVAMQSLYQDENGEWKLPPIQSFGIGGFLESQTRAAERSGGALPQYGGWQRVVVSRATGNKILWDDWDVKTMHPGAIKEVTWEPIEGYEGKYGLDGSNMFITKDGQIIQRGQFATTFYDKENYTTSETVLNAEADARIAEMFSAPIAEEIKNISWENANKLYEEDQANQASDSFSASGTSSGYDEELDPEIKKINEKFDEFEKGWNKILLDARLETERIGDNQPIQLYRLADSISERGAEQGYKVYEQINAMFKDYLKRTEENPEDYDQEVVDAYLEALDTIAENIESLETEAINQRKALVETYQNRALDVLEVESSRIGSLKSLQQSYFDTINSISSARHEIDKELSASKAMYEWLDEETRQLLFNQEDYNVLSKKLTGIQREANALQKEFNDKLLNATEENMAQITAEYEMQYSLLMKNYEIAKADLEVAKKKQKLNNVLKERNVRMFINGSWQWVANTQDVIDAQNELAEAEYNVHQAKTELSQTKNLNQLTQAENLIGTAMNYIKKGSNEFGYELNKINGLLSGVSTVSIPALDDIINSAGKSIMSFISSLTTIYYGSIYGSVKGGDGTDSKDNIVYRGNGSTYYKENFVGKNPVVDKFLEDQEIEGDFNLIVDPNVDEFLRDQEIEGSYILYGSGTRYTKSGKSLIGEKEPEMYIDNVGHLIPINQPTLGNIGAGGIVFNQSQMTNLRDWWDLSNLAAPSTSFVKNIPMQSESFVFSGDINVYNPTDSKEVADNVVNHIVQGLKLQRKSR